MPLIDDLKEQLKDAEQLIEDLRTRRKSLLADEHSAWLHAEDLQRAIAALTPAPEAPPQTQESAAEVEIPEGFTKWDSGYCPFDIGTELEVLTRHCGVWRVAIQPEAPPLLWEHEGHDLDIIAYRIIEASTHQSEEAAVSDLSGGDDRNDVVVTSPSEVEESRDQSETIESEPDPVLRAFEDDQIIAPTPLIDAQTCEEVDPRVSWDAEPGPHPEDASVFADDPAPEGYAPVTNPEADAIAGAHDYYSPQAQARREQSFLNRFNPFAHKRETEDA